MDWFSFFSELREHFRKKAINPLIATEQLNLEFVLIKAIKGYKQIKKKVQKVLKMLDLETKEKEERKSMLLLSTTELAKNDVMLYARSSGNFKPFNKDKFTRKTTFSPGPRIPRNIHIKKSLLTKYLQVIDKPLKQSLEIAEEVKQKISYVNSITNDKSIKEIPLTDDEANDSKDKLLLDKGNLNDQSEGSLSCDE
jgi:hypothetical protein